MVTVDQVRNVVAELLEVDPAELTPATVLADTSWDSLAVVSFIAAADENFGKALAPRKLAECKTIADLAALVDAAD